MHNRVVQHLREKYETTLGNEVEIVSTNPTQFDHSYDIYLKTNAMPLRQHIWNKSNGDKGIGKNDFAELDKRIDQLIAETNNSQ